MRRIAVPLLFLLACGCQDRGPQAPTQEQSAQLNDAEDMLNDAAKQEGPADRSTGPSKPSH